MTLKKIIFVVFILNLQKMNFINSMQENDHQQESYNEEQMPTDSDSENSNDNIFSIEPHLQLAENIKNYEPEEIKKIQDKLNIVLEPDDLLVPFCVQIVPVEINDNCPSVNLPKYLPFKLLIKENENLIQVGEKLQLSYNCTCNGKLLIHMTFNYIDITKYVAFSLENMIYSVEKNNPRYYSDEDRKKILDKLAQLMPNWTHDKNIKKMLIEQKQDLQKNTGLIPELIDLVADHLV